MRIGVSPPKAKVWVRRNAEWVPTVTTGPGQIKYLQLTNIGDQEVILGDGPPLGWWMAVDLIPRSPGYVSVGSRRYNEWQTLAFEATTDRKEDQAEAFTGPLVNHSSYPTPKKIMIRPKQEVEGRNLEAVGIASRSEGETDPVYRTQDKIAEERMTESEDQRQTRSPPAINAIQVNDDGKCRQAADQEKSRSGQSEEDSNAVKGEKVSTDENKTEEHETSIHYHESGELYAEDVDQHMAVLPEITSPTAEITIDEIQVGEPGIPLTEDQESMRQLIWKNRHLLIGKGNALPPAARGAV